MKIYQLVVWGQIVFNGQQRSVHSKKVYYTEEEALLHEDEFKAEVSTPKDKTDIGYLEKAGLRVFVESLELIDK